MAKTVTAKILLSMNAPSLVVLILEYSVAKKLTKTTHLGFDTSNTNDICQLNKLCKFTGTAHEQFPSLSNKDIRLIIEEGTKLSVKAIGHHKRDEFFKTDGMGLVMTEKEVYASL